MQNAYKYSIIFFLIFSILLLISGFLLFENKIGFSYQDILNYYLGNRNKFIAAKSLSGILKIILPHIFAFGLFTMVILHFLIFTKYHLSKFTKIMIYLTFFTTFIELFSPFFIIYGFKFFAYLKLIGFFTFESIIIWISWVLFSSIIND